MKKMGREIRSGAGISKKPRAVGEGVTMIKKGYTYIL